jgi:L-asparaginase II
MTIAAELPHIHHEESVKHTVDSLVPAVEITRGDAVESVHYAAAAVVDHDGHVVASIGDPHYVTFSRSSLKPFQALAAVMRGFPEKFGLSERHLALACASHSGEPHHTRAALEILQAIGATVDDLQCGTHIPVYLRSDEGNVPPKSDFTQIHNNCSGKHSAMLALAKMLDADLAEYLKYDGRVQTVIRDMIVEVTGADRTKMHWGIDGCSAPNYAMPLSALATGFARYAWAAAQPDEKLSDAKRAGARIARAMMNYPEMISGTGRFDLQLVEAAGRKIFSKVGGEAVECVGIPWKGWGIAIKIGDGSVRAIPPLMTSILNQLGIINEGTQKALAPVAHPKLKNVRGSEIGTARAIVQLKMS